MERDAFYARIREAVARSRAHHVPTNPLATEAEAYVGGGSDPVTHLLNEWRAVGGVGQCTPTAAEARRYLAELVTRRQIRSVLRWRHPLLERLGIDDILHAAGVRVHIWDGDAASLRSSAFTADLGITSVDWAVAESGTLAVCSQVGQDRLASLLPPVFLAFVEPSRVVPDLFDLFDELEHRKHDLPSNLALITGPSKTGDIELKLTTGVHGPGEVHLVIVGGH